jgi:hypothetical protein
MRKIYVLDENNELKEIDAGITQYSELQDAPIINNTIDTLVDDSGKLVSSPGHKWEEDELLRFCEKAADGRYDIITELYGPELLLIHDTKGSVAGRQYRRITAQYDHVYSVNGKLWVNISDTSGSSVIFSWEEPARTVTYGSKTELKYTYYNQSNRAGIIQLFVNGDLKSSYSQNSSTQQQTMDITSYLNVGLNDIELRLSGLGEVEIQPKYTQIKVINLVLKSTFSDRKLYEGNILNYVYSFSGSIAKTAYFQFDELDPVSESFVETQNATGRTIGLDISNLSHGTHTLKVWGEATIDETTIKTDTLVYNLPIWKDGSTITVVYNAPTKIEAGSTVNIQYTPYHKNEYVEVTLDYPEAFNKADIDINILSGVMRTWSFMAETIGTHELQIVSEGASTKIPLEIIQGANINYETSGLIYELDLVGRDNAFDNRNIINYNTIENTPVAAVAEMNDFNYRTDGWLTDEEESNRNILRVNATSYVVYPNMNLFTLLNNSNYTGISFDIDFKSRNTTNSNRTLIQLITKANRGIWIKEQSVVVSIAGSTYTVEYKAEERTRITISIGRNVEGERLIMIYLNGVLSFINAYTSDTFAGYYSDLIINPTAGFVDIYGLRLYSSALNMGQALNNYIASYNTSLERSSLKEKNDIYDENGVVSFSAVSKFMPTFVFKTNDVNKEQNLPPKKGEKRYGPARYIDPIYQMGWEEVYNATKKKPVADVQGTSSQKYPRKNFKVKTNDKHAINSAVVGEKVFTFKKDFMDSSHANNSGLAKLVQTLYFTPVPPQISYIMCQPTDTEVEAFKAYDVSGRLIDFVYIYEFAQSQGEPFASLSAVAIEPALLIEEDKYYFAYTKIGGSQQMKMCEIDAKGYELSKVSIKDKSYVRTTIYGQPCAFFWEDKDGKLEYQGIYNFNTDKVAENNMELENEGTLSFEFANNVTDGVLFRSCENFTSVRNSFEYRAYEKDGISLGIWEDYYDDDKNGALNKWANGGYDEEEECDVPILNALYGTDLDGVEKQLFTKVNEELKPINYPLLTDVIEGTPFYGDEAKTMEIEYRLTDNNIEAAYVAARDISDEIDLTDTIETLGGDDYYASHPELTPVPSVTIANPINCQIINQDTTYVLQWGYEVEGSVKEWFSTCYVTDMIGTISVEHQAIVNQADVSCAIKSGTAGRIQWTYSYPVDRTWVLVIAADNIYTEDGTAFTPVSLRKYDLYEVMHQPIMDVINWVIDCWNDYSTGSKTLNKFLSEFNDHLNKEYVITYYVMGLFAGAADSFAKNMFWNSYDGGHIWYPVYYDIDTCFGLSNDGHPNFPYSLEIYGEGSKLGTADIYNGAKSNFWKLVHAAFDKEIRAKYNELRTEKLTYESVMKVLYDEQIKLIAPAHYNADAAFSYLPYPSYYYTAQGRRYERLKYWVENRFDYLDSAMLNTSYTDDSYELRMNATLPIEITTDMTIYTGIKFGQDREQIIQKRCEANHTISFDPKDYGITQMNDLETLIYGASHITSFGDLSDHQVTSIKAPDSGESVLKTIIIGSEDDNYINNNFTTLTVGKNNLLETVNVSNCVNLGQESTVLDLSKCPSIQNVYAKNTKLTNIMLPEGSPIRILHLPYGVQDIKLINQIKLQDLTIESYGEISSIVWDNVPSTNLTIEEILNNIYETSDNKLGNIRLIGFQPINSLSTGWMDWMIEKQGVNDGGQSVMVPYITGLLPIKTIDTNLLKPYISKFASVLGENFAYVRTFDTEEEVSHYYKYNLTDADYIEITAEEAAQFKLEIYLDQIVADEYIFGVTGEGE